MIAVTGLHLVPPELATRLLAEGGLVEIASAILLAGAGSVALGRFVNGRRGVWGAVAALMIAASLRELDLHDRFTSRGITQLRFYTSADVPGMEKVLAVALLALLACAALPLWRAVRTAFRTGRTVDPVVVLGVGLWLLALGGDRLVRALVFDLGWDPLSGPAFAAFVVEETAELWGAALFFLVVTTPRSSAGTP